MDFPTIIKKNNIYPRDSGKVMVEVDLNRAGLSARSLRTAKCLKCNMEMMEKLVEWKPGIYVRAA